MYTLCLTIATFLLGSLGVFILKGEEGLDGAGVAMLAATSVVYWIFVRLDEITDRLGK